jgi:hypothetical protein
MEILSGGWGGGERDCLPCSERKAIEQQRGQRGEGASRHRKLPKEKPTFKSADRRWESEVYVGHWVYKVLPAVK